MVPPVQVSRLEELLLGETRKHSQLTKDMEGVVRDIQDM